MIVVPLMTRPPLQFGGRHHAWHRPALAGLAIPVRHGPWSQHPIWMFHHRIIVHSTSVRNRLGHPVGDGFTTNRRNGGTPLSGKNSLCRKKWEGPTSRQGTGLLRGDVEINRKVNNIGGPIDQARSGRGCQGDKLPFWAKGDRGVPRGIVEAVPRSPRG